MKVGSIDGTNNKQMQMSMGTTKDNQLQAIEKQIDNVQNQIQKLSENKNLSDDQKMERRKELQQQLQDLNKQLMERKIEIQREKREDNVSNNKVNLHDTAEFSAEGLISASNTMKQIKTTNTVKTSIEGEARVLKSEIKMDKSRGINTEGKESRLAKINDKVSDIMKDINKDIEDINNTVDKKDIDEKQEDIAEENSKNLKEGYHSIDVRA
ncbi:FlxA-like family protein [Clostridium bornimense]|uniref:FlxA-like family protein n=1 Tax=Clostridium bornimense TaxID=1216932 RepID=UPI001C10AF30|nr:FlxA-like family protein [Clostridium bornimense]MBU5316197.1 FlxA-like family protein [Clostridium bornimense]